MTSLKDTLVEADKLLPEYKLPPSAYDHLGAEDKLWIDGGQADYYKYLALLVKLTQPKFVLELGTNRGTSAVCMASELPEKSLLVTVDYAHELIFSSARTMPRIQYVCCDTLEYVPPHEIDLLFIDAEHRPARVLQELSRYTPYCRSGALVAFDDIALDGPHGNMREMWFQLPPPKEERNTLHSSGFGFCQIPGRA